MNRLLTFFRRPIGLSLGVTMLAGCTAGPFPTLTIYETPNAFVRLQTDPQIGQSAGHSHPAQVPAEQIGAVLRGIIVEEPLTRLPLYDDLTVPRRHQAFNEEEIAFWAPLLSMALQKATPEEVVTFYQSRRISGVKREVTSGGLFLEGANLHVILSNYRSGTHAAADIGTADTEDDRLTPLRSLAPQKGTLYFEPSAFLRPAEPQGVGRVFPWDRRELIIQVGGLPQPVPSEPSSVRPAR
ncbi:MAG: hypothetical protein K2X00_08625 [Nitrospiraceae bacterium]|jgi:hypothetical protein|nr:hypothetical protein [Nitrospiraceae bacterium]OQW65681.1 MAG: hypothetical protein BVN29_08630 [Nitrospira sp. ST-bin5]